MQLKLRTGAVVVSGLLLLALEKQMRQGGEGGEREEWEGGCPTLPVITVSKVGGFIEGSLPEEKSA